MTNVMEVTLIVVVYWKAFEIIPKNVVAFFLCRYCLEHRGLSRCVPKLRTQFC